MLRWKHMLLVLSLSGCNVATDDSGVAGMRGHPISKRLGAYVQDFLQFYGKPMTAIPISIGKLEAGIAGKCYIPGSGGKGAVDTVGDSVFGPAPQRTRRIVISDTFYEVHKDDPAAMQNVVFHELGHCILNRGHDKAQMQTNEFGQIPYSIMFPTTFGEKPFYSAFLDHYVAELFGRLKQQNPQSLTLTKSPDHGSCVEFEP